MQIFKHELKKLLCSPSLLVFLALCIGFNVFLILVDYFDDYSDYVGDVSRTTGFTLGTEFDGNLANLPHDEYRDWLQSDTQGAEDIFDGYTTDYIAEKYIARLGLTGRMAEAMRDKYAKLQTSVDDKAATDESLSLYFASATYSMHRDLFSGVLFRITIQMALLASLAMLLSIGYEHTSNTALVVYATKTGRRITHHKLLASVTTGFIAMAVLTSITLAVYFSVNDFGNIWGSSISSLFNYFRDFDSTARPFVTWQNHTVLTYLLSTLGISALLTLCFALMAYCIGTWLKNSYMGFLIFILINAALFASAYMLPSGSPPQFAVTLSPMWLWVLQPVWFSDGGISVLWANFETLGVAVSLALLTGFGIFSTIMFRKRDVL